MEKQSVFATLNSVNCNEHTEKKNGLTYLSWAWAWAEVKKRYPKAIYTIYENQEGWNYFTDGRTCWVKTGVTIERIEHIEYLPVMDYRNASIPFDKVTSFDVNKAIQRSLTKAAARHGLGLYIYAGEDLPEDAPAQPAEKPAVTVKPVCPDDVWWKLVKMEVEGLKTKTGLSALQYMASKYSVDQVVLAKFNNDVQMSRDAFEANSNTQNNEQHTL
ncbi:MAG: DUF1071 domain-containing protein [Bacteroidales bacterium]|nr:DUF1071 domain-containing protein [Bacteroidales bacterium]